ncbi:S66 peptidase family protein [Actinorugispora endophytica]|uniref:Muramoyltetrapeptide carboxypeptidase n=1 Tax=Actinorugispora endophytica TaxID=1605990 RepID=A0A4R6UY80_9ACTN|nr:LD-carboxypeptidase [Actinorugispora endophytica]TDQ52452.1 muramoyltetrapeptide carboxypeptidase [Actinorugispora endophytica]
MTPVRALRRPHRLRPGTRVSVVSPCSPVPPDRLERACAIVRGWGLEPVLGRHVLDRHPRLPYLAGSAADRAADLQEAWLDPGTAAVLCARGGNGAHQVVDLLDYAAMRRVPPKAFVGYSDVTALHEAFAIELGVATLHGPVVASTEFVDQAFTARELRATLFEPETRTRLSSPTARTLLPGLARGVTFGGNLSLLSDGLATPHSRLSGAGGILLLEDVAEDVARIDRMLGQLLRTGWLDGVAGIVLGSWQDCTPGPDVIRALMLERLAPLGVPVVWEFGFGHRPTQLTVPLGVPAVLDADAAVLTLDLPALV